MGQINQKSLIQELKKKEPVPEQSCQSPNSTSNFSLKSPGPGIVTPSPNPDNSKRNSTIKPKKQANLGFGLTFLKINALKLNNVKNSKNLNFLGRQ